MACQPKSSLLLGFVCLKNGFHIFLRTGKHESYFTGKAYEAHSSISTKFYWNAQHPFIYTLSMSAFTIAPQNYKVVTATEWSSEPKILPLKFANP
jgi:hypothetical protein